MAPDPKIARAEKLLRLAAPSSGSTEHERASAALEAAKLIAELDLALVPRAELRAAAKERTKAQRPKPPPPAAAPTSYVSPSFVQGYPFPQPSVQPNYRKPGWYRTRALQASSCADPTCGGPISRGDPVWARGDDSFVEYLHADGPCHW